MEALIRVVVWAFGRQKKVKPVENKNPDYFTEPELYMIKEFLVGEGLIYSNKKQIETEIRNLEKRLAERKEELASMNRREAFAEKLKALIPE